MTWRRVSDWKHSITLVELRDLPIAGLVTPHEQLRERFPRFASVVAETGFARVEPDLAERLRAAGAHLYVVDYHRGVDCLSFGEIAGGRRGETLVDVSALDFGPLSDDELDAIRDDSVDALLQILSEGLVRERLVIVAFHAPPLTDTPEPLDEAELAAIEALDPALLPDASEATVDRVAQAYAAAQPAQYGPALTPEQRREFIRKAALVGVASLAVGLAGWRWVHPMILPLAAPVAVLCATVMAIHAIALRQGR